MADSTATADRAPDMLEHGAATATPADAAEARALPLTTRFTLGPRITGVQKAFLDLHGFLVFAEVARRDELEAILADVDRIEAEWLAEKREQVYGIPLYVGQGLDGRPFIQRFAFTSMFSDRIRDFVRDRRFEPVRRLIGDNARVGDNEKDGVVFNRNLNVPGTTYRSLGWHTDGLRDLFYLRGIKPQLNVGLHFDRCTAKTGGLDLVKAVDNLQPGAWKQPGLVQAAEAFAELAGKGYLMSGSEALSHTEAQAAWCQKKAAFIPCGSWLESEQKDVTPAGFDMVMGTVPARSSSAIASTSSRGSTSSSAEGATTLPLETTGRVWRSAKRRLRTSNTMLPALVTRPAAPPARMRSHASDSISSIASQWSYPAVVDSRTSPGTSAFRSVRAASSSVAASSANAARISGAFSGSRRRSRRSSKSANPRSGGWTTAQRASARRAVGLDATRRHSASNSACRFGRNWFSF